MSAATSAAVRLRLDCADVEAAIHDERKTWTALIIKERRIERIEIEVRIARINRRAILQ